MAQFRPALANVVVGDIVALGDIQLPGVFEPIQEDLFWLRVRCRYVLDPSGHSTGRTAMTASTPMTSIRVKPLPDLCSSNAPAQCWSADIVSAK